ncbi:hypothetical protein AAMO2058_000722600 [Amorphochlora amoebiformis]|mmetsp:Transcript_12736/g.20176  ORF Transcript_12736/g.20176 Transcript_12736/m.20176 type:complete len:148 (-) Transcript_12736:167-610(-)|eukprot:1378650-Amorphochlora_amoeboformis.AAC.1
MRAARTLQRFAARRSVACKGLSSRTFSTLYTSQHEYLKAEGDLYSVGISDHAQQELGDVVFVELPEEGATFSQGDVMGSVESVKAASSVYAPVDMEVVEINENLESECNLINESAESDGWMIKVKATNPDQLSDLMDADAYAKMCAE